MRITFYFITSFLVIGNIAFGQQGDPKATEVWEPVPKTVDPGKSKDLPPSDAIILLNGTDLSGWLGANNQPASWKWEDNAMTVVPGSGEIHSEKKFGSCQLHIEWRTPQIVKGEGQGRGNSGIFFMGRYELQVLDSYNNKTYSNGQAGSIYKQQIPLANASKPPGEWQTYDVIFTAPKFNADGSLNSPARITVFHNGVLIQHNAEIKGPTSYIGKPPYAKHAEKESLSLQDHGDLVSYRNIWIREL